MGPVIEIDDPDDHGWRLPVLTDVALRTRIEPPHGLFIAEGARVIERALTAGYELRSVVMTPEWLERTGRSWRAPTPRSTWHPSRLLHELTGFHVHRGALASVRRRPLPDLDDRARGARGIALVEDIVNHTNLGAVFRAGRPGRRRRHPLAVVRGPALPAFGPGLDGSRVHIALRPGRRSWPSVIRRIRRRASPWLR